MPPIDLNSDTMYRLLVQSVVDYAIYLLSPEGVVTNWNAGAQRAKGYRAAEIVGQHFSVFYSDEERKAGVPQRGLEQARETGRFEATGWRRRKDGSSFWAHVIIDAVRDEDGRLIGFAKITRDITERRQHEQELLKAKELAESYSEEMSQLSRFLDSVIGNIPASLIVRNPRSGEILLANQRAERLFGCNAQTMIGQHPRACLAPEIARYIEMQTTQGACNDSAQPSEECLQTPLGERTLRTRVAVSESEAGQSSYALMITEDVTDELAAHAQIHHMAHHDALTGLANRTLFGERLQEALAESSVGQSLVGVLCLDLDNFKNINDALGHAFGDRLLRSLAVRLQNTLRDHDTLARLGGDEFAIVLRHLDHPKDAHRTAQRLIDVVAPAFLIDDHSFTVGLSVGVAIAPNDHDSADQLLRYADMALYEAKRNGRNRFEYFHPELDAAAKRRRTLETDLRTALHLGQLQMHYQPIIDHLSGHISGYEALMRWLHPLNGLVMPMDFIPLAEETGLIHEVGARALNLACQEAASWKTAQTVAVNLSPVQFRNPELVHIVALALQDSGLAPQRLELEITESVLLDDSDGNIQTLKRLKALGVTIALDDFGTGYSSLSYLRSFAFDRIKIDKSFINDMAHSPEAMSIVRAITGMSASLQIKTTAEGVETEEQLAQLKAQGCSHFQGFLFGHPQPASERLQKRPDACADSATPTADGRSCAHS